MDVIARRRVAAFFVCFVLLIFSRTAFAQLDGRGHGLDGVQERSTIFDPVLESSAEQTLTGFRTEPNTTFFSQELANLQHVENDDYALENTLLTLDLFRSLSAYSRNRAFQAQAIDDKIISESVPASRTNVDGSLLSALEFFGHYPLRREDVIQGLARLTAIVDVNAASAAVQPEIRFWRAEGYRELGEYQQAEQEYSQAILKSADPRLTALTNFRLAELLERDGRLQSADSSFLAVTRVSQSPLILLARLRRAATLRAAKNYAAVLTELDAADSFYKASSLRLRTSARDFEYVSPLLEELMLETTEGDRILASAPNGGLPRNFGPAQSQLVSPYYPSEVALLRGSALSELGRYEESTNVLSAGEQAVTNAHDTTGNSFLAEQAKFIESALRFEKGWSLFQRQKYQEAAASFLELAGADTAHRHLLARDVQSSLRGAGTYFDPFINDSVGGGQSATLDRSVIARNTIDTGFFFYNDFSERARFYAGVALARAGQRKEAADIFLKLAEDKSVLYSDKANYQLALLSFIDRGYQAQALLEPLSFDRSLTGAYSSFLLGELYYRKEIFERAERYFENALAGLPVRDTAIRATAFLERGLSLVPVQNWPEVANSLSTYLAMEPSQIPGKTDEALYWLGKAYLHANQPDSAEQSFKHVLADYPKSSRKIDAQYNYAWSLFQQNNFAAAEPEFEKVVALDSISRFSYDVLARAGDSYYALDNYKKASLLYNQAVDRPAFNDLRTTRALLQLGLTRMKLDSTSSAMTGLNSMRTKYAKSDIVDRAYFDEMIAAYQIKKIPEAEDISAKLVRLFPQSNMAPRALYVSAEERMRTNDLAGAVPYYTQVVRSYPASPEAGPALFHMQETLLTLKQPEQALAVADTFVARNPATPLGPDILMRSGELELRMNQGARAATTYQSFISRYPLNSQIPSAQLALGRAELASGDTVKAREQFAIVTTRYDSTNVAPAGYLELARIARTREPNAATSLYRAAYQSRYSASGAAPIAMAELAQLYLERSQPDSAVAVVDDFASKYSLQAPQVSRTVIRLGTALIDAARYDDARRELERVTTAHPKDMLGGSAMVRIGDSYLAESNWKSANESYILAKKQFTVTQESEIRRLLGLARADSNLGNKTEAIRLLHTLLEIHGVPEIDRENASRLLSELAPPRKSKQKRSAKKEVTE